MRFIELEPFLSNFRSVGKHQEEIVDLFQLMVRFKSEYVEFVIFNLSNREIDATLELKIKDLELYQRSLIFKKMEILVIPDRLFKRDFKKCVPNGCLDVDFVVKVSTLNFDSLFVRQMASPELLLISQQSSPLCSVFKHFTSLLIALHQIGTSMAYHHQ